MDKKLLEDIAKAIYWREFTPAQEKGISDILQNVDIDTDDQANLICDLLKIERRGNRSAIRGVILEHILNKNQI